jgi:aminoglycoside/choline kinase family phosphotransferase
MAAHRLLVPLLRVPAVFHSDRAVPAILIEDFGTVNLSERAKREPKRAVTFFQAAADATAGFRRLPPAIVGDLNPPLDASLFRRELQTTRAEFFTGLLRRKWDSRQRAFFDEWVFRLGERLDALPRTSCHRDLHGDKLFLLPDGAVGVVGFHELRPGPLGYDIAALLFESDSAGLLDGESIDDILRSYARALGLGLSDLMRAVTLCRIQRGWRAAGILAREIRRGHPEGLRPLEVVLASLHRLLADQGDAGTSIPDFVSAEASPSVLDTARRAASASGATEGSKGGRSDRPAPRPPRRRAPAREKDRGPAEAGGKA